MTGRPTWELVAGNRLIDAVALTLIGLGLTGLALTTWLLLI